MSDEIRNKLWNIELVVKDIKQFPQTYTTILKSLCNDGTCQFILRRKLNILCREGKVCKTTIPGTRFGKVIFYTIPKQYSILIESDRIGSNVYCFFDSVYLSKFYLQIKPYWELKNGEWAKGEEKTVFEGNILKLI